MKTKEMILISLGMAMVFVTTMFMKIPNAIGGYFHLGDGLIMLFATILSPIGGFLVGGLGSGLADVAGGYSYYFFYTLAIKGLEGALMAYLFRKFKGKGRLPIYLLGSVIMVVGYFLAKVQLKGSVAIALSGLPENIVQTLTGVVIAYALAPRIIALTQRFFHKEPLVTSQK